MFGKTLDHFDGGLNAKVGMNDSGIELIIGRHELEEMQMVQV